MAAKVAAAKAIVLTEPVARKVARLASVGTDSSPLEKSSAMFSRAMLNDLMFNAVTFSRAMLNDLMFNVVTFNVDMPVGVMSSTARGSLAAISVERAPVIATVSSIARRTSIVVVTARAVVRSVVPKVTPLAAVPLPDMAKR
jgi:hypothetical protein